MGTPAFGLNKPKLIKNYNNLKNEENKIYKIRISLSNLNYTIDGLAKSLYSGLFDWIVWRINNELKPKDAKINKFIGILDIFGFEVFKNNKSKKEICYIPNTHT